MRQADRQTEELLGVYSRPTKAKFHIEAIVNKSVVFLTLQKWAKAARFLAQMCKLTDSTIKVS